MRERSIPSYAVSPDCEKLHDESAARRRKLEYHPHHEAVRSVRRVSDGADDILLFRHPKRSVLVVIALFDSRELFADALALVLFRADFHASFSDESGKLEIALRPEIRKIEKLSSALCL